MFQILRKFHTEEMSTVKAERPAPSAQRHTTAALLNEKRMPVFFSLKENVEVEAPSTQRPAPHYLLSLALEIQETTFFIK